MHVSSTDFATTFLLDAEAVVDDARPGEGHHSEASRDVSAAMLLPQGRPGAWLLFVAVICAYVIVQGVMLRFA